MTMFCTTSAGYFVGKNAPSEGEYDSFDVTPSDSVDLPLNSLGRTPRRIRVGGAGNVSVNLVGGGTAVLTTLTANTTYFCQVSRILSTSTTATGITALY